MDYVRRRKLVDLNNGIKQDFIFSQIFPYPEQMGCSVSTIKKGLTIYPNYTNDSFRVVLKIFMSRLIRFYIYLLVSLVLSIFSKNFLII